MTDESPKRGGENSGGEEATPTPQDSAEAKRLKARRRFLLGGATAAPILVTVNRAKAIGFSVCQSLRGKGGNPGMPAPGSPSDFGGGGADCQSGEQIQKLNDSEPLALDPDESVQ